MSEKEFDSFADDYRTILDGALSLGGGESAYYAERKFDSLRAFYHARPRRLPTAILDFGCGTGTNLPFLRNLFESATLHGVDVSGRSIELAQELRIPDCELHMYDGRVLPYESGKFDLVVISNVLHHIEPSARASTLKAISRCMRPGGLLAVFEHNPANPLTRKVVRDCPFDVGVTLVKPRELRSALTGLGYRMMDHWNIIFFPAVLKRLKFIEPSLRRLPLGAQYATFAEWEG